MVLANTGRYKREYNNDDEGDSIEARLQRALQADKTDLKFGFERHKDPVERCGWLINMNETEIQDEDKKLIAAVDYYFIEDDGSRFKVACPFYPYFYISAKKNSERELATYLNRKFAGMIKSIETIEKEDLDLLNHLTGLKKTYIKLSFLNTKDLKQIKGQLLPIIRKNKEREKSAATFSHVTGGVHDDAQTAGGFKSDQMDNILDIREYDVPFHVRVAIDLKINTGHWYTVKVRGQMHVDIKLCPELLHRPDPVVMAFDIEELLAENADNIGAVAM